MRTMRPGTRGDDVRDVQSRLAALGFRIEPEEHGEYGPSTERAVREFQQGRQLIVDGRVGDETWEELVEAGRALGDRVLYFRYPSFRGDDVRALQAMLNLLGFDAGREDGIFGDRTDLAVRDFQRNVGLVPDGILGAVTLGALTRLRPVGSGPGRSAVREAEALSRMAATLQGARVAVDAGHDEGDPGAVGPSGLTEAEAASRLAAALADELAARGAEPFVLANALAGPERSVAERAGAANERGAEVLVSVHLNGHEDPRAEGALCFYFGRERYVSQAGRRLAELIQEELVRLGLKDGRTHPKSLPLLRETRMPAVHVEPCFITNPREEALLRQDRFRRRVARAIVDGIEQFFGSAPRPSVSRPGRPNASAAGGVGAPAPGGPVASTGDGPDLSAPGGTPPRQEVEAPEHPAQHEPEAERPSRP
jgi:N-acetylmuramoyl-L-alanine amidase